MRAPRVTAARDCGRAGAARPRARGGPRPSTAARAPPPRRRETADTAGTAAPAAALLLALRASWAAAQAGKEAGEGLNRTLDSLSTLGSADDDTIYRDPSDPTRFFKQEDSGFNDALALALLLAVVYLAYTAYATVLGA